MTFLRERLSVHILLSAYLKSIFHTNAYSFSKDFGFPEATQLNNPCNKKDPFLGPIILKGLYCHNKAYFFATFYLRFKVIPVFKVTLYYVRVLF